MSNARLPLALSILLLVAACGDAGTSPTTDADAGTDATTAGCASEGGDSSTTDADASTSAGSSSTSDASSGEGSGGGDGSGSTGEPATSCFADSCEDDGACGSGLVCLPHPTSGEHLCVTLCGPPFACNEVSAAMCDDPGPAACLAVGAIKGCFPAA